MIFQLIKTKIIEKNLLSSLISLNLSKVVNQINFLSFCLSICLSLAEYSSKYQLTKNSRFVFLQDLIRETTFCVCVFFFQMAKGRPWSLDYHINKWYFFLFFILYAPLRCSLAQLRGLSISSLYCCTGCCRCLALVFDFKANENEIEIQHPH